jgi:alkylation response protein AidB-like acyl-CoA dehydrogenase
MALMMEAAAKLRDDIQSHGEINREVVRALGQVGALAPALERVQAGRWRLTLTDSLARYELLRHRARLSLIAVGVEEGMTVADVAEKWGISRQLAARYLRDIEQGH